MALQTKLSLRRKDAAETPVASEEAPAKKTLAPKAEPEAAVTEAAPKKVLLKKRLGEEAPAPAPEEAEPVEAEVVETEAEPEPEAPAPKKLAVRKTEIVAEDGDAEEPGSERAVAAYQPMALGQIDGEIDERDLMRPRINMVQANSSDLEEKGFTVGQIALNGEILIWDKGCPPLNLILMTGRKKFIQKLTDDEYKSDVIPMIFDNSADAEAAGFTTQWEDNTPPTVDPALFTLFLLEQPDFIEPHPIFNLEYGERRFTLAEMRFTGVNYRTSTSGKWLMAQSRTSLRPDTRGYMLGMSCARDKQKSGNIVTVAQFKNLGAHKDMAFARWVLSLG
jgi:hypothetical protein